MRYLVYLEISTEVGNRIDFEEGGPGKIMGLVMERFKPEAVYAEAGSRNVFMVADLDETQMTELMLIASKKLDTYPEFTPVFPGAATPEMAAKAIEEVKKAL
ncbi:MAG: hypothetical protein ACXV3E_08695 [Halobacteriota archaeon]